MQPIDWLLTAVPILVVVAGALFTRHYVQSVADFVAGGRMAGRYLLCNAKGEASSGVANTLSKFQLLLLSGFVLSWWEALTFPVLMLVSISGFVVYRYRQTRAMTLGQFFEMRYSRRFRLFAGVVGFVAGLLNYGIFPAVASNFFVFFLGLPGHFNLPLNLGALHLSLHLSTRVLIMAAYLSCTLWMMTVGGQVALMLTDCVEGIFSHLVFVVVAVAVLCVVSWSQMKTALAAAPPGHSLINPFDQTQTHDFNLGYVLMSLLMAIYGTLTIQKDNGFTSAARTPHEARMGGVLGYWRVMARNAMLVVLAVAALTFMRQPNNPGQAALAVIRDGQLRSQMTVPVALRFMLPVGVKGLFCSIMVLGLIAGDASHMLTWGGVFVQDVILPMRRTPMTPQQHLRYLRWSVVAVAVFAFLFSAGFHQRQYIAMWWALTEGMFASGAGAAIIGGLYWKKGTTQGVWTAFCLGGSVTIVGILAPHWIERFPFNGREVACIAAAVSSAAYIGVSLLTCRQNFDMDQLLNRGRHAVDIDMAAPPEALKPARMARWRKRFALATLLQFNADFTTWDKIVSGGILLWSISWAAIVLVGTLWNLGSPWSSAAWGSYWLVGGVILPLGVLVVTLVWFGVGGIVDLWVFFSRLSGLRRDARDDGSVPVPPEAIPPPPLTDLRHPQPIPLVAGGKGDP